MKGVGSTNKRRPASYVLPEADMPTIKFTKAIIAQLSLESGEKEKLFFDSQMPGFGIRLQGETARWIAQYRVAGKTRRVSLGRREVMPLDQARAAAKEVLSKAGLGIDAQAEKKNARVAARKTLGSAVKEYLEAYEPTVRPNTFKGARHHLMDHWKPLHSEPLESITHADISSRLTNLRKDVGPSAGDHARVALSGLYAWAISEGLALDNPVMRTRASRLVKAKTGEGARGGRDRVLSASELTEVWFACQDDDYGRIIRLLILTLQRRDEIASLGWSEVDEEKGTITLPSARTKNGKEHIVPLSSVAAGILSSLHEHDGREFIFGRSGTSGFSGYSKGKVMLDDRILKARLKRDPKAKPMPNWTLHDLRRTGATMMNESQPLGLGIQPHIVEAVLNHVSGSRAGVAGIYNRALYLSEKQAALEAWGQFVLNLTKSPEQTDGDAQP